MYQQGVSGGQGCCYHRRKYRYRIFVSTGTLYTLIQAGMSECMGLQVPNCSSKFSLKGKVVVLIGKISAACRFLKFSAQELFCNLALLIIQRLQLFVCQCYAQSNNFVTNQLQLFTNN